MLEEPDEVKSCAAVPFGYDVSRMLVVDGNNVIGSRPNGWWRDRAGAASRLAHRLTAYRRRTGEPVLLVLDQPLPGVEEGEHDGVEVRYPRQQGRNAADRRILELLDERAGAAFVLVTSDRQLTAAARTRGVDVVGARTLLRRLDSLGC